MVACYREVYNALGRTYVFDVDFWHLKDPRARMEGSTYKNLPKNYDEDEDWDPMYSVDAFHVGNVCFWVFSNEIYD